MRYTVDSAVKYAASHEWVRPEGDQAVVGVSDYAQHELSDVVYVELPQVGDTVNQGNVLCTLESVKSVSAVYAPVSGMVAVVNSELTDHPEWVNQDPYGNGWLVKLRPSDLGELDALLDADAYQATLPQE